MMVGIFNGVIIPLLDVAQAHTYDVLPFQHYSTNSHRPPQGLGWLVILITMVLFMC